VEKKVIGFPNSVSKEVKFDVTVFSLDEMNVTKIFFNFHIAGKNRLKLRKFVLI
jgi:hypothetical protein